MRAAARSSIASGYRVIGQIYAVPIVLIRKHTSLYICAGTAPRDAGLPGLFRLACRNSTLEFDSGSERTLAACLTHASRTRPSGLVAHGCVTRGNLPLGSE